MEELEKVNSQARQARDSWPTRRPKTGDDEEGRRVHDDGRDHRHPPHRDRAGGRGPQGAAPRQRPGRRAGQGGGRAELDRRAGEADRAQQAPRPARPGQDAGADEHGHGPLSETVGQDVPTFNEVREKIEARYAKANGMAELSEGSVESRMLEVERPPAAPRPTPAWTQCVSRWASPRRPSRSPPPWRSLPRRASQPTTEATTGRVIRGSSVAPSSPPSVVPSDEFGWHRRTGA